jgi:hypothetical protein
MSSTGIPPLPAPTWIRCAMSVSSGGPTSDPSLALGAGKTLRYFASGNGHSPVSCQTS